MTTGAWQRTIKVLREQGRVERGAAGTQGVYDAVLGIACRCRSDLPQKCRLNIPQV